MPAIIPRQLYRGRRHRGVYGGPVAGIAIACVVFLVGVALLFFCCLAMRRRNRRRRMNPTGPPSGAQYHPPYEGQPQQPPRYSGVSGMFSSLFPGKGSYGGGPGMTEAGHGQQYGVQPDGHPPGGQPGGYAGDGGVSQPPPAYSR